LIIYLLWKRPLYLGNCAIYPHHHFAGAVQMLCFAHEIRIFGLTHHQEKTRKRISCKPS